VEKGLSLALWEGLVSVETQPPGHAMLAGKGACVMGASEWLIAWADSCGGQILLQTSRACCGLQDLKCVLVFLSGKPCAPQAS